MSSDDVPIPRMPIRKRRRAMDVGNDVPEITPADVFDPGPMINYPPLPLDTAGLPVQIELRHRIRQLREHDKKAAKELILKTLHAFLIAHRPMDEIARAFGVSVRMVYTWRKELYSRMSIDLRKKKPVDLLATQIMNYERAKAYAWQNASRATDHSDKRGWVLTAMKADAHITDLYARAGLLKDNTVVPVANDDEDISGGAAALGNIAREFLTGGYSHAKKKAAPKVPSAEQDATGSIDEGDFLL